MLIFIILTTEILLIIYPISIFIKIYVPVAIIVSYVIVILAEYYAKKRFYDNLLNTLDKLDEKYLVNELIKNPNFIEGRILKRVLDDIDKSMIENINKYKHFQEEYKEYIELWIHEIKIPIASRQNGNRKQ